MKERGIVGANYNYFQTPRGSRNNVLGKLSKKNLTTQTSPTVNKSINFKPTNEYEFNKRMAHDLSILDDRYFNNQSNDREKLNEHL